MAPLTSKQITRTWPSRLSCVRIAWLVSVLSSWISWNAFASLSSSARTWSHNAGFEPLLLLLGLLQPSITCVCFDQEPKDAPAFFAFLIDVIFLTPLLPDGSCFSCVVVMEVTHFSCGCNVFKSAIYDENWKIHPVVLCQVRNCICLLRLFFTQRRSHSWSFWSSWLLQTTSSVS